MKTKIEAMIGRELEREHRHGVEHFKAGQHAARTVEEPLHDEPLDLYELSYVDQLGFACLLIVDRDGGAWTVLASFRGGQTDAREQRMDQPLSTTMIRTLDEAARAATT